LVIEEPGLVMNVGDIRGDLWGGLMCRRCCAGVRAEDIQ